jgi:hypothetical protein
LGSSPSTAKSKYINKNNKKDWWYTGEYPDADPGQEMQY